MEGLEVLVVEKLVRNSYVLGLFLTLTFVRSLTLSQLKVRFVSEKLVDISLYLTNLTLTSRLGLVRLGLVTYLQT